MPLTKVVVVWFATVFVWLYLWEVSEDFECFVDKDWHPNIKQMIVKQKSL